LVEEILKGILLGAFYGAQAALYGYLKSEELPISWSVIFTKKFWEKFSPEKALKTILLGMVFGAFTQGMQFLPPEMLADPGTMIFINFMNTAIIMGVDQLMKLIVRRTPLVKAWNWLKEKAGILPMQ